MRNTKTRVLVSLAVLVVAGVLGLYTSAGLAPERLRAEVERLLHQATDSPVSMGSLRLVVGFPIQLEATNLRLWGGGLTIERAIGRIDASSLLTGWPRLSRLTLSGAHLRIQRTGRGDGSTWSPAPFAKLAESAAAEHPEPFLAPLHGIEATARFLLSRPLLADTLQLQDCRVSYVHDFSDRGGSIETLWFAGIHGVVRHSRLRGHGTLFVASRVLTADGPRGSVEWEGTRSREGEMRISMAATELEVGTLAPYLQGGRRDGRLEGRLSGVVDYETATPGEGRLDLDLVVHDFASSLGAEGQTRSISVNAFSSRMQVAVDADYLEVSNARIWGPKLGFGLEVVVERPLRPESHAGLAVSLEDMDLEQVSALLGWLPGSVGQRAQEIARSILSGRVAAVEMRGGATLQQWRNAMARRADRLPQGLQVLVDLEDIGIAIGASDRLEHMNARVTWSEDSLMVEGATGMLNGGPLPRLDLSFQGIDRIFASKRRTRVEPSGAAALAGLTPLWTVLSEGGGGANDTVPPVRVEFDHLRHPALFWPLEAVQARFEPTEDGAHVAVSRGTWAGVPMHGAIDFTFRPERRAAVWLEALPEEAEVSTETEGDAAPDALVAPVASDASGTWAAGRFEITPRGGGWLQRAAQGRFRAVLGELHFEGVTAELDPTGELSGSGRLELSRSDEVPYDVRFTLEDGDVSALITRAGFEADAATGRLAVQGTLSGSLRPGRTLIAGLSGLLHLEASDGAIQRSIPPILAVALASEALSGFSSRDHLQYRRCATTLSLDQGHVSTDSFDLDGPDVRLFASGDLDLVHPPHEIDAEVVLFLFRQIDRALGKIPLLNVLLLGDNNNLVAAYYEVVGPWESPEAVGKPLRTLGEGPGTVLIEQIPKIVKKGMEALGDLLIIPQPLTQNGAQSALPPVEEGGT
ncbi:MAG TPA: AsmA-like C-terminal region-containing protein [Myxococcota bacterium]